MMFCIGHIPTDDNDQTQEFETHVLDSLGGLLCSLMISVSAMGALNANVFATGRLCVAASQRRYFPKILSGR